VVEMGVVFMCTYYELRKGIGTGGRKGWDSTLVLEGLCLTDRSID
jgi:hypothetical protein